LVGRLSGLIVVGGKECYEFLQMNCSED